LQVIATVTIRC